MRPAKSPPVRLLVVDDHEIVRKGLRSVLANAHGVEVVGEAAGVAEAISEAIRLTPDVVLMDVRLQDGTGVEACREVLASRPATRVLFLTSFSDEDAVLAAVFAGASGYLLKEIGAGALLTAIASVAAGHSILDPVAVRAMTEKMNAMAGRGAESEGDALSPQERRVLALVARGKTNKEIGATLGLSDKTAKNYLSNIFQKLRVTRRSQAAAIYTSKLR